ASWRSRSSVGTLNSTPTSTRRPFTSRSRKVIFTLSPPAPAPDHAPRSGETRNLLHLPSKRQLAPKSASAAPSTFARFPRVYLCVNHLIDVGQFSRHQDIEACGAFECRPASHLQKARPVPRRKLPISFSYVERNASRCPVELVSCRDLCRYRSKEIANPCAKRDRFAVHIQFFVIKVGGHKARIMSRI